MSWKVIGQTAESSAPLPKHQALQELDDVNTPIDWASIEAKLSDLHASKRGEKAWPPLMMFKALLLQSWYNLSDPGLEKQLVRDLLFRSFVGLSPTDAVPDHSTIWRFRQQLAEEGRIEALFREINEQLSQHGLFIKNGSFILFCGATHFMSIWTLWYPDYWLEGIIKVAMAVISVATAIILIPLIPKVFELPSPKQLRETLCVITAERCHTNSHAERGN